MLAIFFAYFFLSCNANAFDINSVYYINLKKDHEKKRSVEQFIHVLGINNYKRFDAIYGYDVNIIDTKQNKTYFGKDIKTGKLKFNNNFASYDVMCSNELKFKYKSSFLHRNTSAGEIGCYCSHLSIANEILQKKQKYTMILEDDAYDYDYNAMQRYTKTLSSNIDNDCDIIYLANEVKTKGFIYGAQFKIFQKFLNKDDKFIIKLTPLKFFTYPIRISFGSLSQYILTLNGALRIINAIKSEAIPYRAVDTFYYELARAGKIKACVSLEQVSYQNKLHQSNIVEMGRKM